jgi:hypothetical protein
MAARLLATVASAALIGPAASADKPDPGKAAWAKDYPKARPAPAGQTNGEIELLGEYKTNPGWSVKSCSFAYIPKAGGVLSKPVELKFADGKWGAEDDKQKGKIVPAKVPMDRGEWTVRVVVVFEKPGPDGQPVTVPYLVGWTNVEIK